MSPAVKNLGRADFIRLSGAAGAGLSLAFALPAASPKPAAAAEAAGSSAFAPNAWVRIAPDETVTIVVSKSEMGQGVILGLPTVLADELDASMDQVRTEFAPAAPAYGDPAYGGDMITGGSTSVAHGWMPLRQAGATARAMLVSAAAAQWSVDPATCTTKSGSVYHQASNRSATYGSLANAAAAIAVPANVPLKTPDQFTLIGKRSKRPDIRLKVNGTAQYGIDVRIPGMYYAAIARSPVFGGTVKSFNASKAKKIKGVTQVVQVSNGVAVVAKNTWAAFQGKDALEIVWNEGPNAELTTASLFHQAEQLAKSHANERIAVTRGNPDTTDGTVLEATYHGPFLAHATMEPMNTTADVREDSCEIWSPNQVQLRALAAAAKGSGLPPEKCKIHTTFLGGGFGRRLEADYVQEAAEVSKVAKVPVKVMWSREDDVQHDFYRPMSVNVVRGVVSGGTLTALSHQVVSPSWLTRWAPPFVQNGIDPLDILEVIDAPYDVPNFRVAYIEHVQGVPIGSWRAPDANWNGFVTETFVDELAHAAGKDPLEFRLAMMGKTPRAAAVLQMAAEKGGWGKAPPAGRARGLAVTTWAGSYAAMVAEVSMVEKMPKVHRVVAAIDCGTIVNPDIVMQQAQGATNFGLSAALTGKITIAKGRVQQNNFYDYTVLHMADAPSIEAHFIASTETPTGIGEICTPPIGPAVANAIFVLTGKRVRRLPFSEALA
jgi:isoquinoline 1-oxidoreductase beta subunit